jgi:hypothetical protein
MNVAYACPSCGRTTHSEFDENSVDLTCAHCGSQRKIPHGAATREGLSRCLVCPSEELFVRKDFPQQLGVTIVVVGLAASCIPWYFHNWYATFAATCFSATAATPSTAAQRDSIAIRRSTLRRTSATASNKPDCRRAGSR